ncbi:MAG TPA: hypothetical protein VJG32_10225 [Anaerolineae bacterium]|nr:hypothetical protein [Anaerolineae bacterium]
MPGKRASPKPKARIRRFDIFAEYNRQKGVQEGTPPDVAKGYGLWLAKLVAGRRAGHSTAASHAAQSGRRHVHTRVLPAERSKWRTLGGEPQTDELFDKEIVNRMGEDFYKKVFAPAIHQALRKGETYMAIRDNLRDQWKSKRLD